MMTNNIFAFAQVADQIILWILLVLSVVSIAVIIERYFTLNKMTKDSIKMRLRIKNSIQNGTVEDIEEIAKDTSSIEGRAASIAMKSIRENGSKGLVETYNTFVLTEKPELEKHISFLGTIASNAPYVGLLGTVLGIMKAFNDLSLAQEAGQQTVMAGISSALLATAAGLFVAIPAVIAYNFYSKRVKLIIQSLESLKELSLSYTKKKDL